MTACTWFLFGGCWCLAVYMLSDISLQRRHHMTNAMASEITGVWNVCSTICSGAEQIKHKKNSASLAFVRGIHHWPVDSPRSYRVTIEENVSILWRHQAATLVMREGWSEHCGVFGYHNVYRCPSAQRCLAIDHESYSAYDLKRMFDTV